MNETEELKRSFRNMQLIAELTERAKAAEAELKENEGVIAVWRGRTQRAEDRHEAAEAEVRTLRALCAAAYQVVGAADGPVEMLDNLSAAANEMPLPHDTGAGLPWAESETEKDAQRYRWLRSPGNRQSEVVAAYADIELDEAIDAELTKEELKNESL